MDEQNVTAVQELIAPEFSAVMGGNPPMNADDWAGMGLMMYGAFSDGKHTAPYLRVQAVRPHRPGRSDVTRGGRSVWTPRDTPEPGLRIAFVADPDG